LIACVERNDKERELLILANLQGGLPSKRMNFFRMGFADPVDADGKALIYGGERNGVKAIIKQRSEWKLVGQNLWTSGRRAFRFRLLKNSTHGAITCAM